MARRHVGLAIERAALQAAGVSVAARVPPSTFDLNRCKPFVDKLDRLSPRLSMPLLEIRNLTVSFATRSGAFKAVDGVDIVVDHDEVLAIVGELGSGKSVAMLAVMDSCRSPPWSRPT